MSKILVIVSVLWVSFLYGCAPKAAPLPAPAPAPQLPAAPDGKTQWDTIVTAAKREAVLVMISTGGGAVGQALGQAFQQKYGPRVDITSGRGAEITQKVTSERRAGLYSFDVYVGGTTTLVNALKPAGVLDPLETVLVLPEVLDPKVWYFGKLTFVDPDRYIFPGSAYPSPALAINTNLAKPGEIKSYRDLLDPRWKGKIVLNDPTVAGIGLGWFAMVSSQIMNLDYMRQLALQVGAVLRDQRQLVDWLSQGKYPVAVAPLTSVVTDFRQSGAPIEVVTPVEGVHLTTGTGGIALINKAPHPSAARLFINWFLSKEGQEVFSRADGGQSGRLDVSSDHIPDFGKRQPGIKYFWEQTEENLKRNPEQARQAQEIFGPLVR